MDKGLFSKGGSGHSVRTIGSSHHSKSVGSFHNGYVRGIGHTMPESTSGLQHNASPSLCQKIILIILIIFKVSCVLLC